MVGFVIYCVLSLFGDWPSIKRACFMYCKVYLIWCAYDFFISSTIFEEKLSRSSSSFNFVPIVKDEFYKLFWHLITSSWNQTTEQEIPNLRIFLTNIQGCCKRGGAVLAKQLTLSQPVGRLCPPHYYEPPRFSDLATALIFIMLSFSTGKLNKKTVLDQ